MKKVIVKVTQSCPTLRPHGQSMGFSRPENWSGHPFPSPGDLPNPGIEPRSPALQAESLPAELQGKPHCHNVWNRQWISLVLKANVRGGKQRIVPKVKENRNHLSLTWLTVLSVMWCHIIVSKSGDGSQFLQRLDLDKKKKKYSTFYKLKRSRSARTNACEGKAFKWNEKSRLNAYSTE